MLKKTQHTKLIILIDPDKYNPELIKQINNTKVQYIFVGGSKLKDNNLATTVKSIKRLTNKRVIIFPGDETQITKFADGILILSLLSGRNPDYLIGKQVLAAKKIKATHITVIPTGYILIDGGNTSTTQIVSNTLPLKQKKDIISTAIAGELIGKQIIYLESGSGAKKTLSNHIIQEVKQNISIPLIIGGGLNSIEKIKKCLMANPDYIVIGNALERNPNLLTEINTLFK